MARFRNHSHLWATFHNFWQLSGAFHKFWHLLTSFGNFWLLASFGNLEQHLPCFGNFWHFDIFKQFLTHFFLQILDLSKLLATFVTFWHTLATFANVTVRQSCNLLPLMLPCHHIIKSSYPLITSSYLVNLSSCPLLICQSDSLSIFQLVDLLACKPVSFSACASWSLRACTESGAF